MPSKRIRHELRKSHRGTLSILKNKGVLTNTDVERIEELVPRHPELITAINRVKAGRDRTTHILDVLREVELRVFRAKRR